MVKFLLLNNFFLTFSPDLVYFKIFFLIIFTINDNFQIVIV